MSLLSECKKFIKRFSERSFRAFPVVMAIMLSACGTGGDDAYVDAFSAEGSYGNVVKGCELLCLAEDRSEAEKIAEQYGIELKDYNNGVATFHTDEDPGKVIEKGKKKGWKELSINRYNEVF